MSPIPFRWEGDSFTPLAGFGKRCDQEFVIGQVYHLEEVHQRSAASHAQYFAALNEAFQNLPEKLAEQFASTEHLRKFALIRSGYRDERSIIASSKAEAQRLFPHLAVTLKTADALLLLDYALRTLEGLR